MKLKIYSFINMRIWVFTFCTLLFVRGYGESVIVTDPEILKKIEGDWYGDHVEPNNISVPYMLEYEIAPRRIHIRVKDSLLILKSYRIENYEQHHVEIMEDSTVYLIVSSNAWAINAYFRHGLSVYIDLVGQKLQLHAFERGSRYFYRSSKRSDQLHLLAYDWKEKGCGLDNQYKLTCAKGGNGLHLFSLRNDTLVHFDVSKTKEGNFETYDKVRDLYLYDTDRNDFVKYDDTQYRLKMVNDSTVAFLRPLDTLYLERIKGNEFDGGLGSAVLWESTSRSDVYMSISSGSIWTNINDTITLGPSPKSPEKGFTASLTTRMYIVGNETVSTVFFYTNNDEWFSPNYGDIVTLLKSNLVPYKLWSTSSALIDIATGEVFSIVVGVGEDPLYNMPKLKSNPVLEKAEILNCSHFDYEIHNAQGVLQKRGTASNGSVSMDDLYTGTYLLKLQTPTMVQVLKVVKE